MNKWITVLIIIVLLAGVGVTGVLYAQETSKLKNTQADIASLEGDVATLGADLAAA